MQFGDVTDEIYNKAFHSLAIKFPISLTICDTMDVDQLEEYESGEESSSDEEDFAESISNLKYAKLAENLKRFKTFSMKSSEDFCYTKAYGSSEEKKVQETNLEDVIFSEECGLRFHRCFLKKSVHRIEIATVGRGDCGKTELIKSVFGDHPSFTSKNRVSRDEYCIYLSKAVFFHIWIYDVKEAEYMRKADFRNKTVFFFCYDTDNLETLKDLEETWIPLIFNDFDKKMFYFLVGIDRDPETALKAVNVVNSQDYKMAIGEKIWDYFYQLVSGCLKCSIDDKESMLNVFQTAIDTAYPRTSVG